MIKLYGAARTRAARCLWMLEEIGCEYEHIDFEGMTDDQRTAMLEPVNPIAKIPSLEDGNVRLFESMAINLYLAEHYGGDLWPESAADRARTTAWSIWGMTELEPPLAQLFFERTLKAPDAHDPENDARAEQQMVRPMTALENELSRSDYLLGNRFTAADLNLASVMTLIARGKYDVSRYPAIERWLGRCYERPSFQASRPG